MLTPLQHTKKIICRKLCWRKNKTSYTPAIGPKTMRRKSFTKCPKTIRRINQEGRSSLSKPKTSSLRKEKENNSEESNSHQTRKRDGASTNIA